MKKSYKKVAEAFFNIGMKVLEDEVDGDWFWDVV